MADTSGRGLPFGLSSPEIFQQKLCQALQGLEGIEILADDILCVGRGKTEQEAMVNHNQCLTALLERCKQTGIKLNRTKMRLNRSEVQFFGHVLSKDGLKPDPGKTSAISKMPQPSNAAELQRFLGLANYMSKFIPKLSEMSVELRDALAEDAWSWGKRRRETFVALKNQIAQITSLKYYNPRI